jgi:hypothetical protein
LKQVNLHEPLPYKEPEEIFPEELEVAGKTAIEMNTRTFNSMMMD